MIIGFLLRLINLAFTIYTLLLIVRAILPWLGVSYAHPAMRFLLSITEPLLIPIRRRLPPMGGIDWSPMVLILILWLVEQLLVWLLISLR